MKWLKAQKGLNLTGKHSNEFDSMQLLPPNKTSVRQRDGKHLAVVRSVSDICLLFPISMQVLQYIDHGSEKPGRHASVRLLDAPSETPEYFHISVGPLPITNATRWQQLSYPCSTTTGGRIRALAGGSNAKWKEYGYWLRFDVVCQCTDNQTASSSPTSRSRSEILQTVSGTSQRTTTITIAVRTPIGSMSN